MLQERVVPSEALERFQGVFRTEHREVRDLLLALVEAFGRRDVPRARALLSEIATLTGPHFRFEEESMYPALVEIFGDEYIEKLLGDHDFAIGAAGRLVQIAGHEVLDDGDVAEGIRLTRGILPHVSDCEGLTIMVERLATEQVQTILDTRDRARRENLNLLDWAAQVRPRPAATLA